LIHFKSTERANCPFHLTLALTLSLGTTLSALKPPSSSRVLVITAMPPLYDGGSACWGVEARVEVVGSEGMWSAFRDPWDMVVFSFALERDRHPWDVMGKAASALAVGKSMRRLQRRKAHWKTSRNVVTYYFTDGNIDDTFAAEEPTLKKTSRTVDCPKVCGARWGNRGTWWCSRSLWRGEAPLGCNGEGCERSCRG
jgi:hypothetical protein